MARGEASGVRILRPRLPSSSLDSAITETQEESSPWRSLPVEILERALALLPLPDVFRLRAVCKRWNAVIHCADFQEMSLKCPVSWGPFYSPRIGWRGRGSPVISWSSYELAERKWIPMPQFEFPLLNRKCGWNLMGANGGLVCFRSADGRRILVCNPMTNKWKELPSGRLDSRLVVISFVFVDEQRSSYKILLAGSFAHTWPDPRCGMVDLYDSIANTWSPGEDMSAGRVFRCGAYCNGEFFVLTSLFRFGPYEVRILDLTTLRWRDKTISIPEGFEMYAYIVTCSGCVYLVGGSAIATSSMRFGSIGIFRLDPSNLSRWIKVSEYSDEKFFGSTEGLIYRCGSHGSKIYVVTLEWVVVYDFATGIWEEPFGGNFTDMKDVFETKFTLQPNLRVAP